MKQVMRESLLIKLPVLLGDFILLNCTWLLALVIHPMPARDLLFTEVFAALNFCFIPGLSWFGVILSSRIVPYERIVRRVFYVVLCHGVFFLSIQAVWNSGMLEWRLLALFYTLLTTSLIVWRLVCRFVVMAFRSRGGNSRRIVLVGGKDNALDVYNEMLNTSTGYQVVGFFSNHNEHALPAQIPCLGNVDAVLPWLKENKVDEVYCCLSTEPYVAQIMGMMDFCEDNFVRFYSVPNLRNYLRRRMNLELLGDVPILYVREEPLQQFVNRFFKRAFDIVFSALFLCTLFPPIYLFVAISTKLTSKGPVFFKQKRNGELGRTFECLKFRSMRVNAHADTLQATPNDPRRTCFGAFLRRTSIDELPQFINVLRGEMSVVGPRPHMLQHTKQYSKLVKKYMVRHLIKPGITGWAQVTGYRGETRTLAQMEGRVRRDIWYLENWSLLLDVRIILMTVWNAVKRDKNAY